MNALHEEAFKLLFMELLLRNPRWRDLPDEYLYYLYQHELTQTALKEIENYLVLGDEEKNKKIAIDHAKNIVNIYHQCRLDELKEMLRKYPTQEYEILKRIQRRIKLMQ